MVFELREKGGPGDKVSAYRKTEGVVLEDAVYCFALDEELEEDSYMVIESACGKVFEVYSPPVEFEIVELD